MLHEEVLRLCARAFCRRALSCPPFFCHAPLDVFDYLQLCCLVVMIRVWGGHLH